MYIKAILMFTWNFKNLKKNNNQYETKQVYWVFLIKFVNWKFLFNVLHWSKKLIFTVNSQCLTVKNSYIWYTIILFYFEHF